MSDSSPVFHQTVHAALGLSLLIKVLYGFEVQNPNEYPLLVFKLIFQVTVRLDESV